MQTHLKLLKEDRVNQEFIIAKKLLLKKSNAEKVKKTQGMDFKPVEICTLDW